MTLSQELTRELVNQPTAWIDRGPTPETGHWLWRGPMLKDSPTLYASRSSKISVRRLFYDLTYRPLRRSEKVTMTCSTHRCIRPSHMTVK